MTLSQGKTARAVAVVGVLTAAMGSAGVAQTPAPGLGTWKLNVAKSETNSLEKGSAWWSEIRERVHGVPRE